MILSQRLKYALFLPLFIIATLVLSFSNVQLASAATLTWTGGGDGTTFADGDNWSTAAAPVDGDIIAFTPLAGGTDNQTIQLTNDLVGVEFAGVIQTNSGSNLSKQFSIDTITFQDDATITTTGSGAKTGTITFYRTGDVYGPSGVLNALGDLSSDGSLAATMHVAGNLSVAAGYLFVYGASNIDGNLTAQGGTLVNTDVEGTITLPTNNLGLRFQNGPTTIANNMTINAYDSAEVLNQLAFGKCASQGGGSGGFGSAVPVTVGCLTYGSITYTLTGAITLNADLVIHVASNATVKLTGTIDYNGHTITKQSTSLGSLVVGGDAVEVPKKTTTISGDKTDSGDADATVSIVNQETATLSGSRYLIYVEAGGMLKGTGIVELLGTYSGGIVNPGNSPGTLTVLSTFAHQGIYEAEILNEDSYDQLRVGEDYTGGGNAVTIYDSGFLNLVLYDGWSIEEGDEFTIIDNRSDTDVNGTFANLDEGTQFTVEDGDTSIVFSITYVGGDGNDVVVTALNAGEDPTPPNTGVAQIIMANPIVLTTLMAVSVTVLAIIAIRRRQTN